MRLEESNVQTSVVPVRTLVVPSPSESIILSTPTPESPVAMTMSQAIPEPSAVIKSATPTPVPVEPTPIPRPLPTNTPAPRPAPFLDGPLTDATVKNALAGDKTQVWLPFDMSKPESLDVTAGQVLLSYLWDYTSKPLDWMTSGGYAAYNASRVLFANPRVQTVAVKLRSHYADNLGNTIIEPSTTIVIRRPTADRIDWDGLGVLVLNDNKRIFCAADQWFIHPLLYDMVNEKGCLGQAQKTRVQ